MGKLKDNYLRREELDVDLWKRNDIQFPRLLAEIRAVGLTGKQIQGICQSMNLPTRDVHELLKRAEKVWEEIKDDHLK